MRNHRKHRRKTRCRPIAVAALAMGAVVVPSAAMACVGDGGADAITATSRPWKDGRKASWGAYRGWDVRTAKPAATASPSPTTPRGTVAPALEKPKAPVSKATTPPALTRTTAAPPKPAATTAPAAGMAPSAVARVVALVNSERAKVGCSPVTLNAKLSQAAQAHSADMASHNTMSHIGSDGSDPGQRITRAGYLWSTYGENVAYGYSTPEQVMAGWMASAGHKRNILDCGFKEIGAAVAQPGNYWTQDFSTAR